MRDPTLNAIDRSVPAGLDVHIILDNYGAHETDKVNLNP